MYCLFIIIPAAAIASGFLNALITEGHLSSDKSYITVDGKKMWRAKEQVMSMSKAARNQKAEEKPIYGIFFDGKKDKQTKVLIYFEDTSRYHPCVIQEEHYSVTWEPQGKYLCHFTPHKPGVGETPAEMDATGVYVWLCERVAVGDLVLIRRYSTSTNTGCWGGAIVYLEKMVRHKCHWMVCWIHINELSLRHLIEKLDGPFIPESGFTGPIGKLLHKVDDMEINYSFKGLPDTNNIR